MFIFFKFLLKIRQRAQNGVSYAKSQSPNLDLITVLAFSTIEPSTT